MYFFQATGPTDQKSLVNFAFGLINTEEEEGIASPPQPTDDNREGMLQAWRNVVFAIKEADFELAW